MARGRRFKRRLPAAFGRTPFYVSPDSALKYLRLGPTAFNVNLLRIAKENVKPGSRVWDIGANVGVFTFAAAGVARDVSVLSVEADTWLVELLRLSARLRENRDLDIKVLPAAISDSQGISAFLIARRGRASNSLESSGGRSQAGGARERCFVPTVTLDSLLRVFEAPTFVKIDVEGAEAPALRGAGELLARVRPAFYIEVGGPGTDEVTEILLAHNYLLLDGTAPGADRRPLKRCSFNTLALPAEMSRA